MSENDGKIRIKIVREGGNDHAVEVAFKTADFTAEYGMDYIVFDEDGNELPMTVLHRTKASSLKRDARAF